jgi:hypothetical protein
MGTVTRYTGSVASPGDAKESHEFLAALESQLAAEALKYSDITYLDRANIDQIFHEIHLSSSSQFDPTTGSLAGLLGRLDELVVIDSSGPNDARLRLIEVETGAVRAVGNCKRPTSFFGSSSDAVAACIQPFALQASLVARKRLSVKQDRLNRRAEAQREQDQQRASEAKQAAEQQAAYNRQAQRQREAEAEEARQEQQARAQAEVETNAIRPSLDSALARLSSENSFWRDLGQQLSNSGRSLRPEIRSSLDGANKEAAVCNSLVQRVLANQLQDCVAELTHRLDHLEEYK